MKRSPYLMHFFNQAYAPELLADSSKKQTEKWRYSVRRFCNALARPATVDDLSAENGRRLVSWMLARGIRHDEIRRTRDQIHALWMHAAKLGLKGPSEMPRIVTPKRRSHVEGELGELLERLFFPTQQIDLRKTYASQFRMGLRRLNALLGRPATLADLTAEKVRAACDGVRVDGMSAEYAMMLLKRLRHFWWFLHEREMVGPPPKRMSGPRKAPRSSRSLATEAAAQLPMNGSTNHEGPSPTWTMREFATRWFVPIVLYSEKNAAASTIACYFVAVDWWEKLTSNPTLAVFGNRNAAVMMLADFTGKLRQATYRRGYCNVGQPTGKERRLSEASVNRTLRCLRAMMTRLGPEKDDDRVYAEMFERAPRVRAPKLAPSYPKPAFTIDDARAIAGACDLMTQPEGDVPPGEWWLALVSVLYYSGLRIGTVLQLEWSMLRFDAGIWILDVPSRIVSKTGKAIRRPMHADCLDALRRIRRDRPKVFEWPHHRRFLNTSHGRLQRLADLPPERIGSIHQWRRTHGTQMARVGAGFAMQVAQRSLDHADMRTTAQSYVNLEAEFIAQLPRLLDPAAVVRDVGPIAPSSLCLPTRTSPETEQQRVAEIRQTFALEAAELEEIDLTAPAM